MRFFTKHVFTLAFMLSATIVLAQETTKSKEKKSDKKSTKTTEQKSHSKEEEKPAGKSEGKVKDNQNQTEYMKPDMENQNFNFYRRREISTPLQPSYDTDSAAYQKGKKQSKQQQSYMSKQYYFPAKPKDAWELGVNFGFAFISGDVRPAVTAKTIFQNIAVGVTVRKAIGYTFSIRGGYNFYMMTGRNWEPDGNLKFNRALHGYYDSRVNYWNNPQLAPPFTKSPDSLNMNKKFFYNYRTWGHEGHIEGIVNLGNIRFHKERNIVNVYALAGVSALFTTTYMDALNDQGGVHDFSEVMALYYNNANQNNPPVNTKITNNRKEALKRLNGILDGKYESAADRETNVWGIKNWQFVPSATIGAGIQFHASKWLSIGLEERVLITGSDLLDGYRWQQDEYGGLTRDNDNISYTSINLNIHLLTKGRTEPMYWLNPMHHTYKKLGDSDPQAMANELFKDDDDDGVPNKLDKEPATKKDCPVDVKGVALDSDKDGIIDCDDKEPYSPPSFPIDSFGVAIIPPNPCCDTAGIGDGINGIDGPGGGGLGGNGKGRRGNSGYDCAKMELPSVVFDGDKYYLDPQYYGNLHQIAERMQMCPDMKLVVTGYDESKNDQKYNEQLAWNRANAAVDFLVEKYGISRDRFIVKYQGGKKAASGTAYEKKMKNKVEFRYANDGEGGDNNPPAPHPGLKAGSNK